jgi:hypothetical protein
MLDNGHPRETKRYQHPTENKKVEILWSLWSRKAEMGGGGCLHAPFCILTTLQQGCVQRI